MVRLPCRRAHARTHGGAAGRAWYAEDAIAFSPDEVPPLHPVFLDRSPLLLLRLSLRGETSIFALADQYVFFGSPAGMVSELEPSNPATFTALGTVANATELVITPDGVYNLKEFPLDGEMPQVLAELARGLPSLTPPVSGLLVPQPDAGRLLVVSSGDTLYSADVSQQLTTSDGGVNGPLLPPATLFHRVVPAPGVPVRDLAVGRTTSGSSGTRSTVGFFVLARDEVFAVDVVSNDDWRVTPIPLPADFGPPRELWTEDGDGRVAFLRGYISALPTPVQLAEPFDPSGEVIAQDFARLCGDTFAIVGAGVQHYVTGAKTWSPVPGVTLTPEQAATARFWESGPSTFLSAGDGLVLELLPMLGDGGQPTCY
ncbi:MAG: hypothetical protein AB1938_12870 [Myxococcota bacterium]